MMKKVSAKKVIDYKLRLTGQYTRIARGAVAQLVALRKDVAAELEDGLKRSAMLTTFQAKKKLANIDRAIADQYSAMQVDLVDELTELYKAGVNWQSNTFEVDIGGAQTSEDFIRAFIENDPFDGKLLKELMGEQTLAVQNAVKRTVRLGIVNGQSLGKIVDAIAHDPVNPFSSARHKIEAMVRTASAHVTAKTDLIGFEAAGVGEYQLSAVLDVRTSLICASLSGKKFSMSDPKKKVPPFHFGCRTTMIPVFDGDDPVPENFDAYLNSVDEETQIESLGPAYHRLWKNGASLESFVNQNTLHVIPLNQMKGLTLP